MFASLRHHQNPRRNFRRHDRLRRLPHLLLRGAQPPADRQVIDGRVASAVKTATSSMATTFERDAFQARVDREKADRLAAEQATTEAKKRAEATEAAKAQADARIKQLQASAKADNMQAGAQRSYYG